VDDDLCSDTSPGPNQPYPRPQPTPKLRLSSLTDRYLPQVKSLGPKYAGYRQYPLHDLSLSLAALDRLLTGYINKVSFLLSG
jgi:hypothetical protein